MSISSERRTAVITGASAGIGRATARLLAEQGWNVIGIGRDAARSAESEAELGSAAQGGKVHFLRADFTSMADVKRLAGEIAALTGRIDTLINNAGGVRDARYETVDGLEATFAANHLAPFLLTRELLPLLRATVPLAGAENVRVLAVSSTGHEYCKAMNWDDLQFTENFSTGAAYCQAKLANLLFTRELARQLASEGIVAQAMHPGVVASNFASHGDKQMQDHMATIGGTGPDVPARTLAWLATSAEAGKDGGRYFHNEKEAAMAPQAVDADAAARLWSESEAILDRLGL